MLSCITYYLTTLWKKCIEIKKNPYKVNDNSSKQGHAISNTFKSVAGSSVTTVAGFVALCVMTFALGRDLGIVMAKGVLIGVICCVTVLPSLVLVFDKPIEKTKPMIL